MANAFAKYYKEKVFKESADMRLTQIDFAINDLIAELQSVVDPTKWNELLRQKEVLEAERELLVDAIDHVGYGN